MSTVYLGIDYGTVHIGVALAEHILATPLPTLTNNEHLIKNLMSIIEYCGRTPVRQDRG